MVVLMISEQPVLELERGNTPSIRRAMNVDAGAIATLHRGQFPRHSVSRLPLRLASRLFACYMRDCIVFVATGAGSGDVIGYVLGGNVDVLDRARLHFTLDNLPGLAMAALRNTSPSTIYRYCALLLGMSSNADLPATTNVQVRYIAVRPDARREGVGSRLIASFEGAISPATAYHVWVSRNSPEAVGFYESLAFVEEAYSGAHLRMIKDLDRRDPPPSPPLANRAPR